LLSIINFVTFVDTVQWHNTHARTRACTYIHNIVYLHILQLIILIPHFVQKKKTGMCQDAYWYSFVCTNRLIW